TQRSVLKIEDVTILPLLEYPKSRDVLRDIADRIETPVPAETFPGWEFFVPLARPRTESIFTLSRPALVVLDEPEQIAAAADRLWKRLEDPERPGPCPPEI